MAQTKFWTRTVSEWLEQWLEDWMLAKKASTVRGYRSQCRTNITPYIGDIPICELGVEDINRLYKTLATLEDTITRATGRKCGSCSQRCPFPGRQRPRQFYDVRFLILERRDNERSN